MAYGKTVSVYRKSNDIIKVLHNEFGYTVTNLRDFLISDFGYTSVKDIKEHLKISNYALYAPLVYRDNLGRSLLTKLIEELLNKYTTGEVRKITCLEFYWMGHFYKVSPISISSFRAENVFEEHVKLLLKQNRFINYENPRYLP